MGARVRFISPVDEKAESILAFPRGSCCCCCRCHSCHPVGVGGLGGRERESARAKEGEASSGGRAGQGRGSLVPPLSILCKIEFNHRRHHHQASMGMYVKTISLPFLVSLWSASSRAAGSAFLLWRTLSLLCRFDSVSLWGNCSSFSFPSLPL